MHNTCLILEKEGVLIQKTNLLCVQQHQLKQLGVRSVLMVTHWMGCHVQQQNLILKIQRVPYYDN